ncbi:MAG: nucleotidyltransferase domain-containing protein [Candidatus Liptonbacteria bacterium]|nr:nucleotidyltransferase domain-containing protein [Candidatus Liptonbacteria bacterium]
MKNVRKITNYLSKIPAIQAVYLFGSVAEGRERQDSDVDIAVLLSYKLTASQRFHLRTRLSADLAGQMKRRVDVVVLNDVQSVFFKYVIIKEGRLIYQRSELSRAEFECRTLGDYFDFQPFLNLYNQHYVTRNAR